MRDLFLTLRIGISTLVSVPLVFLGLVGIPVSLLCLLDPVGTMLADDHNTHAGPPTLTDGLSVVAWYAVLLVVGALVFHFGVVRTIDSSRGKGGTGSSIGRHPGRTAS